MKNIQVIDGALNCTFSLFQATDEEFALIFPEPRQDIQYAEDLAKLPEQEAINLALGRIWERPIRKQDAQGIHGTLFYQLERYKAWYRAKREGAIDAAAINPAQRRLFGSSPSEIPPFPEHTIPGLNGVLETALYVDDMGRARRFYEDVLRLAPIFEDARLTAYAVGRRSVLLLFLRGSSRETVHMPGGTIPPHDGSGPLHIALAIGAEELSDWEAQLAAHGVAIEGRTTWRRGGTSIYFRDPDSHLLELATPGLWTIY
jgi:catechol 2,3-dioxygenase-like lactoylglutathione lyase family enzyme